jgi:uncharacterized protein with HEPN domain
MPRREAPLLVEDMLEAMRKVARYTAGMDVKEFLGDERTVDAVVRNLEIIGEAAKQLPEAFKAGRPEVPWAQMAGMRNRIVHDYAGVDLELVWFVARMSLPELERAIEGLI